MTKSCIVFTEYTSIYKSCSVFINQAIYLVNRARDLGFRHIIRPKTQDLVHPVTYLVNPMQDLLNTGLHAHLVNMMGDKVNITTYLVYKYSPDLLNIDTYLVNSRQDLVLYVLHKKVSKF